MAYPSGCPFFVESEDLCPRPKLTTREMTKLILRHRQEIVTNELSRLACDEYLDDMMQHVQQMEEETLPDVSLIELQREIQWFMRPYLIDFLIEAHAAFSLLPETLFLTVNLLDRYCSKRIVYKHHYQLVGCAALLIAAKYGDKKDRVPQINELINMCCGLYDAGMFTQMEMHVLNTLEWSVGHPTVDFFTKLLAADEGDSRDVEHMAAFLSEIALFHRDFVSTRPSTMARASLSLARAILGKPDPNAVRIHPDWDHDDNLAVLALSKHLHQPSVTLAKKYSSTLMSRVSTRLAEFIAHQHLLARRSTLPPSPPTEHVFAAAVTPKHADIYSTPQKGHGAVHGIADGYLTPPITPELYFDRTKDAYPPCSVTPTPQLPQSYQHYAYQPRLCRQSDR